ncbi:MAG: cytochrome c oxidase assembly factor Coa1 family protein [Pirellulales bacterium]
MSSADDQTPEVPRPVDPNGLDPAASLAEPTDDIPQLAEATVAGAPAGGLPAKTGWWARNWLWFVPTIVVAPMLFCCLGCGGLFAFVNASVRQMEAYRLAVDMVEGSEDLAAVIGEPIEVDDSLFSPARASYSNSSDGSRQLQVLFAVRGPRGRATVAAKAKQDNDDWSLVQLEALPFGGKRIVVFHSREAAALADDEVE